MTNFCLPSSGGFKGCGHGHPSHPGQWHWSCCASVQKDSNHCVPSAPTISPTSTSSKSGNAPKSTTFQDSSRISRTTNRSGSSHSRSSSRSRGEMTTTFAKSSYNVSSQNGSHNGTHNGTTASKMKRSSSMAGDSSSIYASSLNRSMRSGSMRSKHSDRQRTPSPVTVPTNQVKTISI